ncbi:MAG: hypothetical protein AB2692_13955 [Candidatus Thiodiazotropha sp.]
MIEVGAEILVVPDGLSDDGSLAHLAVQAVPSRQFALELELQLEHWPSQIAGCARHMLLRVGKINGGSVQKVDSIPCGSALDTYHFTANSDGTHTPNPCLTQADRLWAKVFAVNASLGFDQLFEALLRGTTSLGDAEVLPSRTADLRLFWKLQNQGKPSDTRLPTDPRVLWGKIAAWMEQGPSEAQQAFLDRRFASAAPLDEESRQMALRESLLALLYPTQQMHQNAAMAEIAHADAAEMFRGYMLGLQRPRPVEQADDGETPPKQEPDEEHEEWQGTPVDFAGRKLSTLLSLPSLACYLGLGIEVAVDRQRLLAASEGFGDRLALAVEFAGSDGEPLVKNARLAWTACSLDRAADGTFFTPRPATSGTPPNAIPQVRGLVSARATIGGSTPRFRLSTEDAENMTLDRVRAALHGDPARFMAVDSVKRVAGLVVVDALTDKALAEELALDKQQQQLLSTTDDTLNWAQHLLRGLRPDFALSRVSGMQPTTPEELVWRSICGREVHCEDPEFDPVFRTLAPVKRMLHRDHGVTQVPVEEIPSESSRKVQQVNELFVWQGENIGIPRNLEEPDDDLKAASKAAMDKLPREGILSDPSKDLGLRIRLSLTRDPALKMMPMRENRSYMVGMRVVYANGVSLPLDQAVARYSEGFDDLVLGDDDGTAVTLPPEVAAPPGVHLHWKDVLVSANALTDEAPGESVATLVVRDGEVAAGFGKAGRFITPSRVSFDLAEKQGQFDKVQAAAPPGALAGPDGLWRFGPDGAFAEARFGRRGGAVRYLEKLKVDGKPEYLHQLRFVPGLGYSTNRSVVALDDTTTFGPENQSRGTVAILGNQAARGQQPGRFYAHVYGRQLEARMESLTYRDKWGEEELRITAAGVGPVHRAFWEGNDPTEARPLFLEVIPADTDTGAGFSGTLEKRVQNVSGTSARLPTLEVQLGEGEVWQLRLRPYDKVDDKEHFGQPTLLRLVHAVKKPLRELGHEGCIDVSSGVVETGGGDACTQATSLRLGLNAVTVSVSETAEAGAHPTWGQHVAAYASGGQDMLDWDSREGGDTTFIVGRLALDRKSTGDLRLEATWENFDGETVTLQNGKWIRNPALRRATLMAIDIERGGNPFGLDLLQQGQFFDGDPEQLDTGKLRGQTYAVPKDGQLAREYHVKLLADTAFKDYYTDDRIQTRESDTIVLKKKCTFRPPPPRLAEIETRIHWSDIDEPKTSGRRRSGRLRIRLDEKWFVSGKGERLGIVLKRPGISIVPNSRFAPYISVAGADPTLLSAAVPEFLNVANFKAIPGQEQALFQGVELFLPEQSEQQGMKAVDSPGDLVVGQDTLSVDILALTPQFSETDGLYCDLQVRLDPGKKFNPYNAFVHLGLVRFQDNAVRHLRSSFPLKDPKTKVYLLPDRELRVSTISGTRVRRLELTGSGYALTPDDRRNPLHIKRDWPVINVTLLRWSEENTRWVPEARVIEQGKPESMPNQEFLWRKDFRLGSARLPPYMILVEEFEQLPVDTGGDDDCSDVKRVPRLVYTDIIRGPL